MVRKSMITSNNVNEMIQLTSNLKSIRDISELTRKFLISGSSIIIILIIFFKIKY